LGIIHSAFTPVPGRFKDYIAIPKVNNYQSLHTTVIGPKAERIEIQIRTFEMHEVAERGVAAHWKYKQGNKADGSNKLKWVEELMEFNQNVTSSSEFMDVVKNDLDVGGVFIFTPTGDVKELRYGSTPLDFAYAVHTEVGNKTVGAKVNGKMVPLKHRLKSGDTVEILTSKTQTPSKDWLKICKTSRAITKIKQYLMKVERDEHKIIGEELLEKALKRFDTSIKSVEKRNEFKILMEKYHYKSSEEIFVNVGSGHLPIKEVLVMIPSVAFTETDELDFKEEEKEKEDTYLKKMTKTARKSTSNDNAVIVDGLDDIVVKMGKCCNPIPGDPITGIITRGRGITVHTVGCNRIADLDRARQLRVEWNKHYNFSHPVNIKVTTHDKPGILSKISKSINTAGINIRSAIARSMPDQKGNFIFEIEVKDYSELLKTISTIEQMEEVISVNRA
jgi:guanosine-3',5'-bis(diphosphate) 3'-pyrophosphohydrolase